MLSEPSTQPPQVTSGAAFPLPVDSMHAVFHGSQPQRQPSQGVVEAPTFA
ncbi:MAG TPA: hypothetical protein VI542_21765 [Candidatus Tectomicrobia bacterium]